MKRDMDIVRHILLSLENESPLESSEYPQQLLIDHMMIMKDAELIDADFVNDQEGITRSAMVRRITWKGHDFLSVSRDTKLWKLAKEKVLTPGMSWSFSILVEYLKFEARKHLGLSSHSTPGDS